MTTQHLWVGAGVISLGVVMMGACSGDTTTNPDGGTGNPDSSTGNDATQGSDVAQGTDSTPPGDSGGQTGCEFPSTSTMYQDVSGASLDSAWGAILGGALASGWGGPFQLDPSFTINTADSGVTRRPFTQPSSALPDCDTAPIPLVSGGATEGYPDYFCAQSGNDCHLITCQGSRLYELYQGSVTGGKATGGTFTGTCLVVWDLTKDYWQPGTPFSRGDGCNGADAADMPISTLLLKQAEIVAHNVTHAMRFTIDNSKIDDTYYVHPTTHLGGAGPSGTTLPYGARLRLKKGFDVTTLPSPEAQAIAVALKKYGMFLADGGGFYVSATNDITIDTHDLKVLKPTDFEMVDGGTRYDFHKQNCTRTSISN